MTNLENHFGLYKSIHRLKTVNLFFDCSQKQALKKHIYKIHEEQGKKAFKCDICDQSFSQKGNLTKHTASVHDSKKSFKCDICDHNFSEKANLKIHIAEIHEGEKIFDVIYASTVVPKSKL